MSSARDGALVIVSERDDPHLELVQAHLDRELLIVDAVGDDVSFVHRADGSRVIVRGEPVDDVRSVWFRKPTSLLRTLVDAHIAPKHRRYSRMALNAHVELLWSRWAGARWVSDPWSIERAEDKGLQLELARRHGLQVPETLITNDANAARKFVSERPAVIVKSLCPADVPGGDTQIFYATRVQGLERLEPELPGLQWAPSIFQEPVAAVADVRVTVVEDEVFAARIDAEPDSAGGAGVRDWRLHEHAGVAQFSAEGDLPVSVRDACLAITRGLGLRFAAIDLVIDGSGALWFLELNPNGQWGFIELEAGLPIGAALAALLRS